MKEEIKSIIIMYLNDKKDTKFIINELMTKYNLSKSQSNSYIKTIKKNLGIYNPDKKEIVKKEVIINNSNNFYYDDEDDENFIGGKVKNKKHKRLSD